MATTIQVSNSTKNLLKTIKNRTHADSYDVVLMHLIQEHEQLPASMFGSNKKLKPFSEKDRAEFHKFK